MTATPDAERDGALLRQLRELALVTPDVLATAVSATDRVTDGEVERAHLSHLQAALDDARARSAVLRSGAGPDPYAVIDHRGAPNVLELLDNAAKVGAARLAARAAAFRLAADIDVAAAELMPMLAAWARRLGP